MPMNIDEYRAMKAQEAEGVSANAQVQQQSVETIEQDISQTEQVPSSPESQAVEATSSKVKYGDSEYDVEQLIQAKQQAEQLAQEQARLKEQLQQAEIAQTYFNKMAEQPEYMQTFAENNGLEYIDPTTKKIQDLEKQYNKVLLEQEISLMKTKYEDFNPNEIVQFAVDSQIKNLEDAYLLHKTKNKTEEKVDTSMDINAMKEQIRQELLNELKLEVNTTSLIGAGTGGIQTQATGPKLSPAEQNVARRMRMTDEEYLKFKK